MDGASTDHAESAVSPDEIRRVAAFRSALRGFLRRSERVSRACGLTPQRYLLLLMIKGAADGSESSSVGELAARLHLAQSSVTELVTRAEEAGLVSRTPSSADGRVASLTVSTEGERRLLCALRRLAAERDALTRTIAELDDA